GHRVVALIDGDGSIFNNELLSRGHLGGLQAAGQLSEHLTHYLTQNFGTHPYTLWVYVFLNKRGLMHLLTRQGQQDCSRKVEEFVVGFNQAAPRFSMVDVGRAKEGADAKIKTYLEDEIRASQTFKVIFSGCHDNGYVANLRSYITSGFKDKLILLKGYNDIAAGFSELRLPIMVIPGLFVTEKIPNSERHPLSNFAHKRSDSGTSKPAAQHDYDASSVASFEDDGAVNGTSNNWQPSTRPTALDDTILYNTASPVQSTSGFIPDEDTMTDNEPPTYIFSPGTPRKRTIDPKIPLFKHKPAPCNLFYLVKNCKNGLQCKFGHDYELTEKQIDEMKKNAKRSPCPAVNRGKECSWGSDCCMSHFCPGLSKCYYLKQGRCKFVGRKRFPALQCPCEGADS
ncbi:hypothetical protein K435DRAFT_642543, partial [Dendrothele bispora CBS 962.96]